MIYRVGLSEYKDGLTRRPAATWTIIKLDSEIDDVTCYVTSVEEKETEKEPEQQATTGQVRQLLLLSTSTRHFPNQTSRGQSLRLLNLGRQSANAVLIADLSSCQDGKKLLT